MFTSVYLKNYKSLVDLKVDFERKKNEPKKLAIIYGENGVGKSNFASAFYTLSESLQTMSMKQRFQKAMDSRNEDDGMPDETLIEMIFGQLSDTERIINRCKTIDSKDNMIMRFEFVCCGRKGIYTLEYDNTKLVHEKLDYVLNKNITRVFDITQDNIKINGKLFSDKVYENEIVDLIEKYNGKHSLLSIIVFEKDENAEGYVKDRINPGILEVIDMFMTMAVKEKQGRLGERGKIGLSHKILANLSRGHLLMSEEDELNKAEELLNDFFTNIYSDIKQVYYSREFKDDSIKYQLMIRKLIYGRLIDISFELESTGTSNLLNILPFLLMSVEGEIVVIDEVDSGIHDILVNMLINNIIPSIEGQLIITTHNTMLLDSDIEPEYIYTFIVDKNANKVLESIDRMEGRLHPNLNYRNRYLKGMYGGIPISCDVDFDELNEIFD